MKRVLVVDDLTPVAAYAALRAQAARGPSYLLESAIGGERWGRYSIVGAFPRRAIALDLLAGGEVLRLSILEPGTGRVLETHEGKPRDAMALLRAHVAVPKDEDGLERPRVVGAAVGYVAYDLVHALEPVPAWPGERRLALLLEGATNVIFDGLTQTVTIHGDDVATIDEVEATLARERVRLPIFSPPHRNLRPPLETALDDEAYARVVRRAQEYIVAGDIFQVVLARAFRTPRGRTDPFDVYRALRVLNPSPYLYFLDFSGLASGDAPTAIAGASPETLVRLEEGTVTLRPLAGTRPRGVDDASDRALEAELLVDPKELAEHVMLVDLGRNDIGRIAAIGSVKVPVQMAIERYSHVMHIVSEVQGKLAEGRDAWDVLAATFPAGTLSGAPKVRAMQIIRELEAAPRGVYGGAIGYVGRTHQRDTMDLAIAIRTLVAYQDHFEVEAGAGIVEASEPFLEAAETRHKAGAALSAVVAAEALGALRLR